MVLLLVFGLWNIWDWMIGDEVIVLIYCVVELDVGFFDVVYYNMGLYVENFCIDIFFGEVFCVSGVKCVDIVLCGKFWFWDWLN